METNRTIGVLFAVFLIAAPVCRLHATGGDSFDQPAPSLADSLDLLPGKSLGRIFEETSAPERETTPVDYERELPALATRLDTEPAAKLLTEADALLVRARANYAREGCNLVHDVRDVLASSGSDPEAARDYIRWRVEYFALLGIDLAKDAGETDPAKIRSERVPDLERRAQAAPGPLKAHWLYLCGAILFKAGDRVECQQWFDRVVREFPKHPRAEIALFMSARCALSQSRAESAEAEERAEIRKQAVGIFERYRKEYPRGRFEADALGWLGALAYDGEDYQRALEYYIAQAETPGHPETLTSAIYMCEKSLARAAAKPEGGAAFALAARHPRVAMGLTYLVLSAPEADNYDGKYDKPVNVKKWRQKILPRIAAEVVKQKNLYQANDWQPRYLAMLAHAASAAGNQEQALQLTNLAPGKIEQSDDLLLARAITLQRAGKARDAIDAYRKLLAKFPETPFAAGARLRLALALQDNRQAGAAVVELKEMLDPKTDEASQTAVLEGSRYSQEEVYPEGEIDWELNQSAVYPNITGADREEIQQAIDTLLNFAPLTELAAALSGTDLNDEEKGELRAVIAQRYLAAENFAEARKFMTPAQFDRVAAKLEKLTVAAGVASSDKAETMLRLGDAWAAERGKLLATPLDRGVSILHHAGPSDAILRRINGRALGFKNVEAELENRDELRQASRWWMRAARARPGSALAAQARWKALEAMPKLARASQFAEERAKEIQGESVSRELYQKLRSECPNSIEAQRYAVYWSFPAARKEKTGQDDGAEKSNEETEDGEEEERVSESSSSVYLDRAYDREANPLGYTFSTFGAFAPAEASDVGDYKTREQIAARIVALRGHAKEWEPAKMAAEVRELDTLARKNFTDSAGASTLNLLHDLTHFFSEPKVTREIQQTYVNIRLDVLHRTLWPDAPVQVDISTEDNDGAVVAEIETALKDPVMQPVVDYLEFSLIGLQAGDEIQVETDIVDPKAPETHITYPSRDYAGMEKAARAFLQKYPRSQKREAALFVIARSVQALSRQYICYVATPLPGTAVEEDLIEIVPKPYQREPFEPKRVLGALDDYEREFPRGRYAADVRNFRAMALWRMHEWGKTLDLTLAQADDKSHVDLQPEAGLRLANIFGELEKADCRADLLEAIRTRPAAQLRLKEFLAKAVTERAHPLRYLVSYLSDQLKLKDVASN